MFILMGEFSHKGTPGLAQWLRKHHFGRMWARDHVNRMWDGELWGIDNGAYSAFKNGTDFEIDKFINRLDVALERAPKARGCIVAAVPDIVEGGNKSLAFSVHCIGWLRKQFPEFPWFLVVQDGMNSRDVKHNIHKFDGIFLGGSDEFKKSANFWCQVARSHGKLFHWGRCNNVNALRAARRVGADSIDSATPVIEYGYGTAKGLTRAMAWLQVAAGNDKQADLEFMNQAKAD